MELRNLTGVITKGGQNGWVSGFHIQFSNDGKVWSGILNKEGVDEEFLGNTDSISLKAIHFDIPLRTKLLKIIPIKWHQNIELKIEPIGCFAPYRK